MVPWGLVDNCVCNSLHARSSPNCFQLVSVSIISSRSHAKRKASGCYYLSMKGIDGSQRFLFFWPVVWRAVAYFASIRRLFGKWSGEVSLTSGQMGYQLMVKSNHYWPQDSGQLLSSWIYQNSRNKLSAYQYVCQIVKVPSGLRYFFHDSSHYGKADINHRYVWMNSFCNHSISTALLSQKKIQW